MVEDGSRAVRIYIAGFLIVGFATSSLASPDHALNAAFGACQRHWSEAGYETGYERCSRVEALWMQQRRWDEIESHVAREYAGAEPEEAQDLFVIMKGLGEVK